MASNMPDPRPLTSRSPSTEAKGPLASRYSTMRWASTGPMPSRVSSWAAVAVLMVQGAGLGSWGPASSRWVVTVYPSDRGRPVKNSAAAAAANRSVRTSKNISVFVTFPIGSVVDSLLDFAYNER